MSDSDHFPELAQKLQAIRERIRKRVELTPPPLPQWPSPAAEPPSGRQKMPLAPLVHPGISPASATAIGRVNPRPGGLGNELIQSLKRLLARFSEWQLRPQREFNLAVAESLGKTSEALQGMDRNLGAVWQTLQQALEQRDQRAQLLGQELASLCEQMTVQRWSYEGALTRQTAALRELREELQSVRRRVAAQAKAQAARPEGAPATPAGPATSGGSAASLPIDYFRLEHCFRGSEEDIRTRQSFYLPFFQGRKQVLDIACGRGEFLELMREAGVAARGVDLDGDMIARCLEKKLDVTQADVFTYLEGIPDGTLDGIFSSQFVEHLEPNVYLHLIAQCAEKLAPGGVLALETQNPECLAIFSQSFFIDPTHVRPIPPAQLRFAFAEAGFERISTHSLSPASATLPLIPALPPGGVDADERMAYNRAVQKFNETFFGGMDYAVIGYRTRASA